MNLNKILEKFGLSDVQAKLYLSTLELGFASVYKISQKSGFPRTTCYQVLNVLKEMGAVSSFKKKQTLYYSATDPKALIELTKAKASLLESALPQLNALYGEARSQPTVRFYSGQEGMKVVLEEILDEAKEIKAFNSIDDLLTLLSDYFPKFVQRRIAKKIPAKVIMYDSKKARERQALGPKELRQVKIIDKKYLHHALAMIWQDKVALFSLHKEFVVLVIESKIISDLHKTLFSYIWEN